VQRAHLFLFKKLCSESYLPMDLSIVYTFHHVIDMKKTIAKLILPLIFLTALATPVQAYSYLLTLYADQDTFAGYVHISTGEDSLTVTFDTTFSDWEMLETHLYVGTSPPAKNSPGKFDFKDENLGGVNIVTYTIDYVDIGATEGDIVYVAAHAVVRIWTGCGWQEETGWGSTDCGITTFFDRGWGSYSAIQT
jgi:hypothetical protein